MSNPTPWVKGLVEEHFGGSQLRIGLRVKHPDGRLVEITDGQFWGSHGLSNHWSWREVLNDGSLSDKEENGYGWRVATNEQA